jgi:PHP family Zn ribbon phosphoesterase
MAASCLSIKSASDRIQSAWLASMRSMQIVGSGDTIAPELDEEVWSSASDSPSSMLYRCWRCFHAINGGLRG